MSVKRVINTPRRGIGSTSIAKIEELARENRCSFFQACEIATAETGRFSAKVRSALGDFVALVREAGVWTASCRTWSRRLWSARALCRRSVRGDGRVRGTRREHPGIPGCGGRV